jgi:hypothetical protein
MFLGMPGSGLTLAEKASDMDLAIKPGSSLTIPGSSADTATATVIRALVGVLASILLFVL